MLICTYHLPSVILCVREQAERDARCSMLMGVLTFAPSSSGTQFECNHSFFLKSYMMFTIQPLLLKAQLAQTRGHRAYRVLPVPQHHSHPDSHIQIQARCKTELKWPRDGGQGAQPPVAKEQQEGQSMCQEILYPSWSPERGWER